MPILDGIEAALSTKGRLHDEFSDHMNDVRFSGIPCDLRKEAARLIMLDEIEKDISLNVRLTSGPHTEYAALGFLLTVGEETVSFRYYLADALSVNYQVVSHRDRRQSDRRRGREPLQTLRLKNASQGKQCLSQEDDSLPTYSNFRGHGTITGLQDGKAGC